MKKYYQYKHIRIYYHDLKWKNDKWLLKKKRVVLLGANYSSRTYENGEEMFFLHFFHENTYRTDTLLQDSVRVHNNWGARVFDI